MTNDLVTINNNQIVVSSRMVAEKFGKRHTHVLDSIKQLISSAEKSAEWFCRSSYKDSSGKTNVEYLMNRDGFSLLVMGFTGTEALKWKAVEDKEELAKSLVKAGYNYDEVKLIIAKKYIGGMGK